MFYFVELHDVLRDQTLMLGQQNENKARAF